MKSSKKPSKKKSSKPKHDPFFSKSMEYLPIARDFFKVHIPSSLAPSIDLSTLERSDRILRSSQVFRHKIFRHKKLSESNLP
jgi:hypothetical protein